MSFRFTIGKKIGTGFGVLILFIIIIFGATFLAVNNGIGTFKENDKTSNQLITVLTPTKEHVIAIKTLTIESRQLASQWINDQSRNDVDHKMRFKKIIREDIPENLELLEKISEKWTDEDDLELFRILKDQYVLLFDNYKEIMILLPDISSYDDAIKVFFARELADQNGVGEDLHDLAKNLDFLEKSVVSKQEKAISLNRASSVEARRKFQSLQFYWWLGACLIIFAVIIFFLHERIP